MLIISAFAKSDPLSPLSDRLVRGRRYTSQTHIYRPLSRIGNRLINEVPRRDNVGWLAVGWMVVCGVRCGGWWMRGSQIYILLDNFKNYIKNVSFRFLQAAIINKSTSAVSSIIYQATISFIAHPAGKKLQAVS